MKPAAPLVVMSLALLCGVVSAQPPALPSPDPSPAKPSPAKASPAKPSPAKASPAKPSPKSTTARPAQTIPVAVTISGGGSRGGYMAGQLFYLDHARRLAGGRLDARVFTGASAGSINSLVSAFASCSQPTLDPEKSLYYKTWIPTGLNQAYIPEQVAATGLLSRDGFVTAIDRMHKLWKAGLPKTCDVIVGMAVTRMHPHGVSVVEGFPSLPRSLETALLRITGMGPGKKPLLRNYTDPQSATPQLMLPLDGADAEPFDALRDLIFASSAFPIGFAPVHLAHCLSTPGKSSTCTKAQAKRLWFLDGGVFDNQPLGLAVQAMSGVTVTNGAVRIADVPSGTPNKLARFVYVDPRVSDLPVTSGDENKPAESAFGVLGSMLSMVESARSAQLIRVFERFPQVKQRLLLPRAHLIPIASTFSGFLERSFRDFDFYLGMYDASRSLQHQAFGEVGLSANRTPEALLVKAADAATQRSWRKFFCLRHLIERVGDAKVCEGDDLEDFRILMQVTLDRVYDHCKRMAKSGSPVSAANDHPTCRHAMNGWVARRVPGVRDQSDETRRRGEGEGEIMYLLRLLGRYRFHFKDLGLAREDAEDAPYVLIRLAHRMTQALAEAQPTLALPYSVMGRLAVDAGLGYVPPLHSLHLGVGLGLEFGYSGTFANPRWDWLRMSAALELGGLSSLFNSRDNYLTVIPKIGPEFEVFGNAIVQVRLGARVGFQFSTGDAWRTDPCDHKFEDTVPCSRFVTEAYVAASVLGLVRVQVAGNWLPAIEKDQANLFSVRPMIGLQLNSPF